MNSNDCRFGFRIVGNPTGERRLVDRQAAFAGYCQCDPRAAVDREGYLSTFSFPVEFREYLTTNGTTKGYTGRCGAAWLWFDIDAADDLERALTQARRLCAGIVERYSIDGDRLLIFFSGSKGFHVGLPLPVAGSPDPSDLFHKVAKRVATTIAERGGVAIDTSVYDRVRIFRAPNSRHGKTGLHKRRLTLDELMGLSADAIVRLAQSPEPFDLPEMPDANPLAVADWQQAAESVETEAAALAERRLTNPNATLNRLTLDFIRDGALQGDRHRLLFSAAANLAEFGCPAALAHALLSEPALDAGLTPSQVRRQIDCGLEKGGGA